MGAFNFAKIFRSFGWEINGMLWSVWKFTTSRGGPLWPVSPVWPKFVAPFPKIPISSSTLLSCNQNFGQNANGSLWFETLFHLNNNFCRSIFSCFRLFGFHPACLHFCYKSASEEPFPSKQAPYQVKSSSYKRASLIEFFVENGDERRGVLQGM